MLAKKLTIINASLVEQAEITHANICRLTFAEIMFTYESKITLCKSINHAWVITVRSYFYLSDFSSAKFIYTLGQQQLCDLNHKFYYASHKHSWLIQLATKFMPSMIFCSIFSDIEIRLIEVKWHSGLRWSIKDERMVQKWSSTRRDVKRLQAKYQV